jgi:hypothetical protein
VEAAAVTALPVAAAAAAAVPTARCARRHGVLI